MEFWKQSTNGVGNATNKPTGRVAERSDTPSTVGRDECNQGSFVHPANATNQPAATVDLPFQNTPMAARLHWFVHWFECDMTQDEFDHRHWINGTVVLYRGNWRDVVAVDFVEKLIGLKNIDGDQLDWIRCENISAVTLKT